MNFTKTDDDDDDDTDEDGEDGDDTEEEVTVKVVGGLAEALICWLNLK